MGPFYICATPIGNLNDISSRLNEVLSDADIIYAEDTRVAKKLLSHLNLTKKVHSYFLGNEAKKIDEILHFLNDGKSIAMISDAGTPLISDPGSMLVKELVKKNVNIISIPGPSSVLVALTLSGFDTDKFTFLGFIPRSGKERTKFFDDVRDTELTLICFTSPNRLQKDLKEFVSKNIDNEIVVCRELTKKFESIYRGNAKKLLKDIPDTKYKGEITLVISRSQKINNIDIDNEALAKKLIEYKVPKREIAKIISSITQEKVNKVYDLIKNL